MGHRLLLRGLLLSILWTNGGKEAYFKKKKESSTTNCAVHERKLFQWWWIERNLALLCRTRHDRGKWTSCNPRRAELEKRSNYLARNACIDREHNFLPTRKKESSAEKEERYGEEEEEREKKRIKRFERSNRSITRWIDFTVERFYPWLFEISKFDKNCINKKEKKRKEKNSWIKFPRDTSDS